MFFKTIWRCLEKWSSKPKTAYSLGPLKHHRSSGEAFVGYLYNFQLKKQ